MRVVITLVFLVFMFNDMDYRGLDQPAPVPVSQKDDGFVTIPIKSQVEKVKARKCCPLDPCELAPEIRVPEYRVTKNQ
jgi:hypothetical protein